MERTRLVNFLCQLSEDYQGENNSKETCEHFQDVFEQLNCTYEGVRTNLSKITNYYFSTEETSEWKYICLSFYILQLLNTELEICKEVLSVQQSKTVKKCIRNILNVGICTKLQPNVPLYIKPEQCGDNKDIFLNYNILKCTTFGLCEFMKCTQLRLLILPESLSSILVALYQISFCPLKQPVTLPTKNEENIMTQEMYNKLSEEKKMFIGLLSHLRESIHPRIFIKETMIIFRKNSPTWFKKAVSQTLTSIICSNNGVENIAIALLDGADNDSTQTWKILDVLTKLILSCRNFPDFRVNICKQVTGLLEKVTEDTLIYERIFTHCTKSFYQIDSDLTVDIFVRPIMSFLLYFTYTSHKFDDKEDVTGKIEQTVRLIHSLFVENSTEHPKLPIDILKPVLQVLFRFYVLTSNTSFKSTNNDLSSVLIAYLTKFSEKSFSLFDSFLFDIKSKEILPSRNDIILKTIDGKIVLNYTKHAISFSCTENSDCLLDLLKSKTELLLKLFGFLLNCLINKQKYFEKVNQDLLNLESEFMNAFIERNLIVYKLLSELAERKDIQKQITDNPQDIINYIDTVLKKTIELSTHTADADSDPFQSLFTVLMILQSLVDGCSRAELENYKSLVEPLRLICGAASSKEIQDIIKDILDILAKGKSTRMKVEEVKTELDKALDDICDPLLPVRGHGLMILAKLVQKKDTGVMERKQYVLNIFQQNLKDEDSYIYLSAIEGLAALVDIFPDTILNVLCEEYSDSTKKHNEDGHEVRMKLGETLVKITKVLGEMAPKYKSLLLNTFLIGAKDDDDLIRASSLSNLGEICRVLGYKLGTIVTEVLVCVHAIISTDKSPQARRAAVTVLRQLFVVLEKEMIAFLKDDILPIYRTLKDIYNNDKDDVMRLQAQLALEELNENMKKFVFPTPQLNSEKKIIMLD